MNAKTAALICLSLALAGCASGPPHGGPRGGRDRGPPPGAGGPPRPSLFISPAGEPFRTGQGDPRQAWLRLVDPTASGRIAADALTQDARRYFAVLDANHDGVIDGFEVTAYEQTIVPEILPGGQERGGGPPGGGGLQGAARFGLLNDPQPIRTADFNLDSRVTLIEYERKARETFVRLDRNHDGVLLVSELPPPPSLAPPRGGRPGGGRGGPPGGGGRGGPGGGGGGMGGPGGGF